jgi:hypothetical protein
MTLMRCQEKYRFYEKTDLCTFAAFYEYSGTFFSTIRAGGFKLMTAEQTFLDQPERTGMTASV